ncbi:MAG: hypothetical protein ABR501_10965 [Pyrinomonadaceae bacterium]
MAWHYQGEVVILEVEERKRKLSEFFGFNSNGELLTAASASFNLDSRAAAGLKQFHIEWHIIPSIESIPLDDAYFSRLYPRAPRDFADTVEHRTSYRDRIVAGHRSHEGRIVGVETTLKPRYLPRNRQFYGTLYGFDHSADPFASYIGLAGMMNGIRYDHNYLALREFIRVVTEDWRARSLLPAGYRVTVCPPAIFNLIGTVFHPEWSETETIELGFYRDNEGNATCYAVGSNSPGDFSYINEIEGEGDWSLMGFRIALVPE